MTNLSHFNSNNNESPFDSIRHIDDHGNEFWDARELMSVLGYAKWERFNNVIEIAKENLETVTDEVLSHVSLVWEASGKTKRLNYKLSRLACYHIALSCDSRGNDSVKMAKHYFAVKTREAEVTEKLLEKPSVRELPVYSAIEYLKERGFFFCAKLEKNPKCPELWMATTHLLMIDWNKSNDGEYYSMFPKDFSHPEFDYYEQRCDQLSKLLQLIVSFFEISPNIYWAKSEEEILNILNKVKK